MNDNEMPAKGESVQTYVPLEIKKKLEDWAQEEERSISFLVAKLITEAVEAREAQHKKTAPEPSTGGRGGRGKNKDG